MKIKKNVPLKDKNWFQTGGNAKLFCEPQNPEEFASALCYAKQSNEPIFILGKGANILVSDEGFDGLVIRPQLNEITHSGFAYPGLQTWQATPDKLKKNNTPLVTAGAGVCMNDLIEYCLNHHIIGLEEFSGIPGTVGGSVYINLHYFQFLLAQFLVSARVIEKETGTILNVDKDWFAFGYDYSKLHEKNHFLLDATFALKPATDLEVAFARGRKQEIIRHRTARYPNSHTCGSFFRNFHDHEVSLVIKGKKMIYTAYYLDKIGVKGTLCIGDAIVSHQHANMLVNRGNATTNDIIQLVRIMQQKMVDQFGVLPQPECELVGFKTWPLLQ